jgi:hypothetical protein
MLSSKDMNQYPLLSLYPISAMLSFFGWLVGWFFVFVFFLFCFVLFFLWGGANVGLVCGLVWFSSVQFGFLRQDFSV